MKLKCGLIWLRIDQRLGLGANRLKLGYETTVYLWIEIIVGSRPCSEGFGLGPPVFLPPQKPTFPVLNSTWRQ